jgi:GWxTD domain-containing protein
MIFSRLSLLILLLTAPVILNAQTGEQDWLNRGWVAEYEGDYDGALQIWEEAKKQLPVSDARIGFEYMRLVTTHNISDKYSQATQMYYWALRDPYSGQNRAAIKQEIDRLRPIIGEGIYRQWTEWWEKESSKLSVDMLGFWTQLDPTPSLSNNGRLIEHWERIATAKRMYTKGRNTVYGTDDRGKIFVRYGSPDRVKSGILTLQSQNIRPWINRQFQQLSVAAEDMQDSFTINPEEMAELNQLERFVYEYHAYPEYEIWFYDNLTNDIREPVIFIFGTDVHRGGYGLRSGLDDFIPNRAFEQFLSDDQEYQFVRQGLSAALILQLLYYEQLAAADPFFENRLNSMRDLLLDQREITRRRLDTAVRERNREILTSFEEQAPQQISIYERLMVRIPVHVYQYRIIDEENNPALITFIESEPREAFLIDFQNNRWVDRFSDINLSDIQSASDSLSSYQLSKTMHIYDNNWGINELIEMNPVLFFTNENILEPTKEFLTIPHQKRAEQAVSVLFKNEHPGTRFIYNTPFNSEIRGFGKILARQPEPLNTDPDNLEVADLIIGYGKTDNNQEKFPFTVANNQIIPFGESIIIHFEVYNLQPRPIGFTWFELTYEILPIEEDGTISDDKEAFTLTLNFESEYKRVIENLEIETLSLGEGLYELHVRIEDKVNGQSKERHTRFEVIDNQ